MVHFEQEVVVVDLLALEGIVACTLDGIGVGASSTRNEVSDASVPEALVVMNVAGEDHELGADASLPLLKKFRHMLFGGSSGVSAS